MIRAFIVYKSFAKSRDPLIFSLSLIYLFAEQMCVCVCVHNTDIYLGQAGGEYCRFQTNGVWVNEVLLSVYI